MMMFFIRHPSCIRLSELAGAAPSRAHPRLASHLAKCADCRARLQTMRAVQEGLRDWPALAPPGTLHDRILASRASGTRVILPSAAAPTRPASRWIAAATAAAIIVVGAVLSAVLSSTQLADAGATSGRMTIVPAMPRAGQRVRVTYSAPVTLARSDTLVLRARLRTAHSPAYQDGIPVRTMATLRHAHGVGEYSATFTLPDSVVFAAVAVENGSASVVDDNAKRTWEILTTVDGRRPSFESLEQRANDMMGRNFAEGLATTRRMVALYPDSIRGWSYLLAFQSWMGEGDVDSIRAAHRAALVRLDRRWHDSTSVPNEVIGRLYWYARQVDPKVAAYWQRRMLREAPTNSFAVQKRLADVLVDVHKNHDTATALVRLDTLWRDRTADRAPQVASYVLPLVVATGNSELIDRWWRRVDSVSRDRVGAELSLAEQLSRKPSLIGDAVAHLRRLAPRLDASPVVDRYLTETSEEHASRIAARRRRVLASFGQSLVATGDARAGLDKLRRADSTGWDLGVARSIASAEFIAGDSTRAWEMNARIVTDPSTTDTLRDSLDAAARSAVGDARWRTMREDAGRLFSQRLLATSQVRTIAKSARLRDEHSSVRSLHELVNGRVTVVAMWSRYCGWALDDLDDLADVAQRLEKVGGRLVLVIDDEIGPSAELTKLLADHKVIARPYFDVDGSVSKALNSWGTPHYYVLDDGGRLRFGPDETASSAFAQAEALRLANRSARVTEQ